MKAKTRNQTILLVLGLAVLVCLPGTGQTADVRQISPAQQTRQPVQKLQPRTLQPAPSVQTSVPTITSVKPEQPTLTAGGKAVSVTLTGTKLNLITSVQILFDCTIVTNVTAQLGESAPTSRQVTLTAKSGAPAGKYQVRLLAGSEVIDLNTKVVSVIVKAPPARAIKPDRDRKKSQKVPSTRIKASPEKIRAESGKPSQTIQPPSPGLFTEKTTQGTSPSRDMESTGIPAETSGAVADRSTERLSASKPSDTVMIDTVPLPEKTISGPTRAVPQTPTTGEAEETRMQPLKAPVPLTDTSGAKKMAIIQDRAVRERVEMKEGLKPRSGISTPLIKPQEPSTSSVRIPTPQMAERRQIPSGVVTVPLTAHITEPNKNTVWFKGVEVPIKWEAGFNQPLSALGENVSIHLQREHPQLGLQTHVITWKTPNDGEYIWRASWEAYTIKGSHPWLDWSQFKLSEEDIDVPAGPDVGGGYQIRIIYNMTSFFDFESIESGVFNISMPTYTWDITSPNDSNVWETGKTYTISWNGGPEGDVAVDVVERRESGETGVPFKFYVIESLAVEPNNHSYTWTIPENWNPALEYYINLTDQSSGRVRARRFMIVNKVNIISPNGGETYITGPEKNIPINFDWDYGEYKIVILKENREITHKFCRWDMWNPRSCSVVIDNSILFPAGSDYQVKVVPTKIRKHPSSNLISTEYLNSGLQSHLEDTSDATFSIQNSE